MSMDQQAIADRLIELGWARPTADACSFESIELHSLTAQEWRWYVTKDNRILHGPTFHRAKPLSQKTRDIVMNPNLQVAS
jgi:hypothetical protein